MTALLPYVIAAALLFALYKGGGMLLSHVGKRMAEPGPPPAPEGVRVIRDVEYTRTPDGPLLLDIYSPESPADEPLPVLLYILGGGWSVGNKNQISGLKFHRFAQHGYAVVSIDYRLSHVARFPAQIQDCKAAARWIRKNAEKYNFDPTRIAAFGGSAGGHLSALMGTTGDVEDLEGTDLGESEKEHAGPVQAVVDLFGPSDLNRIDEQRLWLGTRHAAPSSPVTKLLGDTIENAPEQAKRASPVTYVKPGMPPFLIIHGARDHIVPVWQSRILHEALQACGNESELIVLERAGHVTIGAFSNDDMFAKILSFFDRHLKS